MATLTALQAASPLDLNDGSRLLFANDTNLEVLERALDDVDSDFGKMTALSWQVDYRQQGRSDDTLGLEICIVNGLTVLAGASLTFASRFQTVATDIQNTTDVLSSVTAFTVINTDADEASWNNAVVQVRQTYSKEKGGDGCHVEVDFTEFTGTYSTDPGGTFAGATYVNVGSGGNTAQTSITVTPPSGWSDGDWMGLVVSHEDVTATLTTPSGWTRITAAGGTNFGGAMIEVVWRKLQTGDTSWDWTTDIAVDFAYGAIVLNGQETTTPIEASDIEVEGSTDSTTSPYAVSTQDDVVAVTFAAVDVQSSPGSYSIDTGTERLDLELGGNMALSIYTEEVVNAVGLARNVLHSDSASEVGGVMLLVAPGVGGTTVQRTFTGVITSGNLLGALTKESQVTFEGSDTPIGDLNKKGSVTFEGSDTPTGDLNKKGSVTFEGADTPTGLLTKVAQLPRSGVITTLVGALMKQAQIVRSGSDTPTGDLASKPLLVFEGSDTPTGNLNKKASVTFEGSDTPTGALSVIKLKLLAIAGIISSLTGALTKQAQKPFAGADTPTGSLNKKAEVTFEGSDTPTGALAVTKLFFESMAGVISSITGALSLKAKKIWTGTDTPTGTLDKKGLVTFEGADTPTGALTKEAQVTFEGADTPTGALSAIKKKLISMAGTISTLTGVLAKQAQKAFTGSDTPIGSLTKEAQITFEGSDTPTGTLSVTKLFFESMAGAITSLAGALALKARKTLTGSDTPTGSLTKKAEVTFEGSDTPTGSLSTIKKVFLAVAGVLTSSGGLAKKVGKQASGTLTSVGTLAKLVQVSMAGSVTSAGGLAKKMSKVLVGVLATAGSLATNAIIIAGVAAIRAYRGSVQSIFSRKDPDDFSGGSEDSFEGKGL